MLDGGEHFVTLSRLVQARTSIEISAATAVVSCPGRFGSDDAIVDSLLWTKVC